MQTVYVLDRLILKPVKLTFDKEIIFPPKTMVVYQDADKTQNVGTVLGYSTQAAKEGKLLYALEGQKKIDFEGYQDKAKELYKSFKAIFPAQFPEAVPLTARMNVLGNQIYFYFQAETRFQFSEFVKQFRQQIGYHFFLYQVSSRDRVRLHPNLETRFDPSGMPLSYHLFKHPLPNVENDVIAQQQLEGRSLEKLKDRSGKLDHSLLFEAERYAEEIKKYPAKGSVVQREGKAMKCMGFNLLTQEIKLRGKSDEEGRDDRRGERKTILFNDFVSTKKKP